MRPENLEKKVNTILTFRCQSLKFLTQVSICTKSFDSITRSQALKSNFSLVRFVVRFCSFGTVFKNLLFSGSVQLTLVTFFIPIKAAL